MNKIRLAATVLSALMAFGVLAVAQAQSTAPAVPAAPAAAQAKRPGDAGNGWRIKFDRSAKADGVLHFRLWPYNADPIDINIPVKQGQTENAMARMERTTRSFRLQILVRSQRSCLEMPRRSSIPVFRMSRRKAAVASRTSVT